MPSLLYPLRKSTGTQWIGGWVGPRTGFDVVARKISCPARNQTLVIQPTA